MGAKRVKIVKDVFYVRGLVCEIKPTVCMVVAKDAHEAALQATEYGVTGKVEVIHIDDWEGLIRPDENFMIGFVN